MVDLKESLGFLNDDSELRVLTVIDKAMYEYSYLTDLYTIPSISKNDIIMRRLLRDIVEDMGTKIDIAVRLNSLYQQSVNESIQLSNLILEFRRRIMNVKIQLDKQGYIREDTDISKIVDFVDFNRYGYRQEKTPLRNITYATIQQYINYVIMLKETILEEIQETDLSDIINYYPVYNNIPEYKAVYTALFNDIDIIDILDIETDMHKLWERGCSKELYILTKVAIEELYKREMLEID